MTQRHQKQQHRAVPAVDLTELSFKLDAILSHIEKQETLNQEILTRIDRSLSQSDIVGLAVREIAATSHRRGKTTRKKKWYQFWK